MGRELKRKQAKREGRNVKEVQIKKKEANELKPKSLLTILGVLVLVFGVLYLITGLFIKAMMSIMSTIMIVVIRMIVLVIM